MEDDSLRLADVCDLPHRLDHADFVVHHHDRSEDGIGADRRLELLDVDQTILLHLEISRLEPLALELAESVEHGLVLGLLRDEVLAFGLVEVGGALDREVVALGRARGPDDLLRVGVDQRRDMRARLFDRLLGLPAERVRAARRIAEMLGQIRDHLRRDAWIDRRGRRIIQIDRQLHAGTFSAFSVGLKSLITATGLPL